MLNSVGGLCAVFKGTSVNKYCNFFLAVFSCVGSAIEKTVSGFNQSQCSLSECNGGREARKQGICRACISVVAPGIPCKTRRENKRVLSSENTVVLLRNWSSCPGMGVQDST